MLKENQMKLLIEQLGYTSFTKFFNIHVLINLVLSSRDKKMSKIRLKSLLQVNERTIYRYVSEIPFLEMKNGFVIFKNR